MNESNQVYEIAILGRAVWQLHSLNNEGTVGNVTEPRNIRIIDPNTKKAVTTDGISGEMLKHIHTRIMWYLCDKSNLCNACKILNPEKYNLVMKKKENTPSVNEAINEALESCDICDVHGFLLEKPTASRKSTVEFGWAVGIPDVYRDIHTHARHAPGEKEKSQKDTSIPTQMVYHRPTRSGIYAIISLFQPWRIGLNEAAQEKYTYSVSSEVRKRRYELALKAYQFLFTRPEGAMNTTRLPHVENFSGIIIYSTNPTPVPVISPLQDNYIEEIRKIIQNIGNGSLVVMEFNSIADFEAKIDTLLNKEPYKISTERRL